MAGRLPNPLFWKSLSSRVFSAQTAFKPAESVPHVSLPKESLQLSKLENGAVVASIENYSQVSRIGVYFKAGARYEPADLPGLTHCLKVTATLGTKKSSHFNLVKNIEQAGANIRSVNSREYLGYSLTCKRDELDYLIHYIAEVSTQPMFRPWEVKEASKFMHLDLAHLNFSPEVKLMESLHKIAFKRGLSNSIFAPSYMIGHYTSEDLHEYVKNNCVATNMAIIGLGVDHDALLKYCKSYFRPSTSVMPSKSTNKYIGGEIRIDTDDDLTYVVMAAEGAGWKNPKDVLALSILQHIMGTGSTIKRGSNTATSKLGKAGAEAVDSPFYVTSLNYVYEDTGLFGFYAVGQPKEISKLLGGIVQQYGSVTKSGVTDQEVERAKTQLKSALFMESEDCDDLLQDLGFQASSEGRCVTVSDIAKEIDAIKPADVTNVAKRVITGKPSLAVLGDLSNAPYLDDFK